MLFLARHRQSSVTQLPCSAGKIVQVLGRSKVLFSLCLGGSKDKLSLSCRLLPRPQFSLSTYLHGRWSAVSIMLYNWHHGFPILLLPRQNPLTKTVTQGSLFPLDCLNCLLKMKYVVCMDTGIYD